MKVILKEDVETLGKRGDTIKEPMFGMLMVSFLMMKS